MSYKLKSLLFLLGFITSSIVYQYYLDQKQRPTTVRDPLKLAQMKKLDSAAQTPHARVSDVDYNKDTP